MFGYIAKLSQEMTRSRRGRAGMFLYFKRLQRPYGLFFVTAVYNTKTCF